MRELSLNEIEQVDGGWVNIVVAVIGAIAVIGAAIISSGSSSNSGSGAAGSVNCPDGTVPKITNEESTCVKPAQA